MRKFIGRPLAIKIFLEEERRKIAEEKEFPSLPTNYKDNPINPRVASLVKKGVINGRKKQ